MTFLQRSAEKEKEDDEWPEGFYPTSATALLQEDLKEATRVGNKESVKQGGKEFEKNDIGLFDFKLGSWTCGSAALPPQVQDPVTFMWQDRGYLVFERPSCTGGEFDTKCYCWDNFLLVSGQDPLTSEFQCDGGCGLGPCAGKTCSSGGPPDPPAPSAPPPPSVEEVEDMRQGELKSSDNKMTPLN